MQTDTEPTSSTSCQMEAENNITNDHSSLPLIETTEKDETILMIDEKEESDDMSLLGSESQARNGIDITQMKSPCLMTPKRNKMKALAHLVRRPAVNIDFTDLSYTVPYHPGSGLTGKLNSYRLRIIQRIMWILCGYDFYIRCQLHVNWVILQPFNHTGNTFVYSRCLSHAIGSKFVSLNNESVISTYLI